MRPTFVFSALALVVSAFAGPIPLAKRDGPVKENSYIIKFKSDAPADSLDTLKNGLTQDGSTVLYSYDAVFKGAAAQLFGSDLSYVQQLESVEYVVEDTAVSVSYTQGTADGSSSVEARSDVMSSSMFDKRAGDGTGVTVYAIDTGIYLEHTCFEGRAKWGKTFGGYSDADGNGHGTHTAALIVGKDHGRATGAEIVAIKVLGDDGTGAQSDVIAGVDYTYQQFIALGHKRAIATISLGGPGASQPPLNDALRAAIAAGLHFVVAGGDGSVPTDIVSPANVAEANTIGAVDSNNQKASFSNYGGFIDVWAPGVDIDSAWIGNPTATQVMSGTSMAASYVASILAVALESGEKSPQELSQSLKDNASEVVTFSQDDAAAIRSSTRLLAQPF